MGNTCRKNQVSDIVEKSDNNLAKATFSNTDELIYEFTKAKIIKVYDGDTYWIAAEHNNKIYKFMVRLYGVDCPELKGGTETTKMHGKNARNYVNRLIMNKIVDIIVLNNRIYEGKKVHEKYGRLIVKIFINGTDLSEDLIKKGYAKPYIGNKKNEWTDKDCEH